MRGSRLRRQRGGLPLLLANVLSGAIAVIVRGVANVSVRRTRIRVGAVVAAALALTTGTIVVATPASAARIVATDIRVSIGLVIKNETDIQISVNFRNLGPEVLTEDFQVGGITQYPGPIPTLLTEGCTPSVNVFYCPVTLRSGSLAVGSTVTKVLRFSTSNGCNTGCDIGFILEGRFGDQNPDLNFDNDQADIIDGRKA